MNDIQHQYRVMFDNMAQGAFYQLADGSLVDVNSAALEMFGVSRDTFIGRTSDDLGYQVVTEDGKDLPVDRHPSLRALRTGRPVRNFVAGVFNRRQQRFVWMNINAIPMFRPGAPLPYQVFVTLHDISEQKRLNDIHLSRIHLMQFAYTHPLEEMLVEALDELERLTDSFIGFYHYFDEESRFVTLKAWSTRTATTFCRMDGATTGHYSVDEAGVWTDCLREGKAVLHNDYHALPHRRGLPPGHSPVTREIVVPVLRNGRIVAILGIGNKPNPYTEVDLRTASLFADLTWDIAERKQAELLRFQASRQYETLTNTAMDGYWVLDADGCILSVNETGCRMLGYNAEELVGKHVSTLHSEDDGLREHLSRVRERSYDRFETRQRHKDGSSIEVEISAAFITESGRYLAFSRDVTRHNQLQADLLKNREELKQLNAQLELRVEKRTADLRAAIREQESFSYTVSHDLRAPLRHINSFSAMLKEDYGKQLPPGVCDYLDRIMGASNQMGSLIDHLLELSRVARVSVKAVRVDLSELAAATLRMHQETEPQRRVQTRVQPGVCALGDRQMLGQLLGNLLGNSWKYTGRRDEPLIEFGRDTVAGQEVYFVRDNGTGFDMTYKENLFKAFQRLHGPEYEGIGIGLATAQRIVQRHGGKIWAEGEMGRGATFYFTLS